ncbi:MAG: caspase family protein [Candidatus Microthrix sp.]|nr:caspase family protein [Candidatus Microthrix sp.]
MDVGECLGFHQWIASVKRALLVGIDQYDRLSPLSGCINDVHALNPLFARNHDDSPNFSCQIRTGGLAKGRVTRDSFFADLSALFAGGADFALLYFAGHGAASTNDVSMCMSDGTLHSPGIKLSEVLAAAAESTVGEIVILLDCCFSGAAGEVPQLQASGSMLPKGLAVLTASRGDQEAAEVAGGRGAFSKFLEGGLEGGAADVLGKVSLAGLYAYLDECFDPWDQRPGFKGNLERLTPLRTCSPSVAQAILRRLPGFFPDPDGQFSLDPSYEPTEQPSHPVHEEIFAQLQKCRAAKLVEPVANEHMYYAALESTGCRLTPLGKHYRHMAAVGLL